MDPEQTQDPEGIEDALAEVKEPKKEDIEGLDEEDTEDEEEA